MRRIFFLFLIFLTSSSFAAVSIGGISVATEQVQSNLKENANFISTGDNIKNLEAKRIELLSALKLEKSDNDIVRQKNTLVKLITDIENLLKEWSTHSIEKIQLSTRTDLTPEEILQLENISTELETQQDSISKKILSLSQVLDF